MSILSWPLKLPIKSPLPSSFKRPTTVSYQIFRAASVDPPTSFCKIFETISFVTRLPPAPRPLINKSPKSTSNFRCFKCGLALKTIVTTSRSPFGCTVKYNILEPLVPLVKSYSVSRVIELTLKRFIIAGPTLPS